MMMTISEPNEILVNEWVFTVYHGQNQTEITYLIHNIPMNNLCIKAITQFLLFNLNDINLND